MKPEDFVIATGQQHSVREFVDAACHRARHGSVGGKAPAARKGATTRPANASSQSIPVLPTDRSRYAARRCGQGAGQAGLDAEGTFKELVAEMVREDLKAAERDDLGPAPRLQRVRPPRVIAWSWATRYTSRATGVWSDPRLRGDWTQPATETSSHAPMPSSTSPSKPRCAISSRANGRSTCFWPRPRSAAFSPTTTYPADFVQHNLAIQTNVIHEAWRSGVVRLVFLGSSCIYPRDCPQPIKEEYLLTGPLEPTNRPYAIAKIAGIEMCWSYNRQYGTRFLAVMPTNLYGPGDNFDLQTSHVLPALIRKLHEAKVAGSDSVTVWGNGRAAPRISPQRRYGGCRGLSCEPPRRAIRLDAVRAAAAAARQYRFW